MGKIQRRSLLIRRGKFHFKNMKSKKAQTLVEVMIALFVLVTGILGILSLLAQSIALSRTVNNETVATYLAAEGIEVAKNLIDHDVYEHLNNLDGGPGTGWGTCFGVAGGDYELDYTTGVLAKCPPSPRAYSNTDFLEYNPTTHRYLYAYDDVVGGGQPTEFTREVKVTPDSSNPSDEVTVTSIVYWGSGLAAQNITLEDKFYNWHP
jgi:hypothetical protein